MALVPPETDEQREKIFVSYIVAAHLSAEAQTRLDALLLDHKNRKVFFHLRRQWRRADRLKHLRPPNGSIDADLLILQRRLQSARIVMPPGRTLDRVLNALLTPKAYRTRVLIGISEMRAECYDALAEGRIWKARWISLRGQVLIVWPFVCALMPRRIRKMF